MNKNRLRLAACSAALIALCAAAPCISAEETTTGWVVNQSDKVCYIGEDGEKYTGLCEIEGETYYFAPNGPLRYGWFDVDGKRLFFDLETGALKTGWVHYMDNRFYCDPEKVSFQGHARLTAL